MKKLYSFLVIFLSICLVSIAQVDTTEIYNTTKPYGTLDIRIAKSATQYYYLKEGETFSYRESSPGVRSTTYYSMNGWGDSSPYTQGHLREKNGSKDNFVMNYRLLFPENYTDEHAADSYPLIVMMHGAGERANCWGTNCFFPGQPTWNPVTNNPPAPSTDLQLLNNDYSLTHAGREHLNARNAAGSKNPGDTTLAPGAFSGFVLFAQNLNGWDVNSVQSAIKIIRLAVKKYRIDPNRIIIHGLSNGGSATFEAVKRAPWLFAGALGMSAITDASIVSKGMIPKVAAIPVWLFQGGIDTQIIPFKTEGYIRAYKAAGMDVKYTLYPGLGHNTWYPAYREPDFFPWIKEKDKSKVHVFYNNPKICTTTGAGAKLGFTFGFRAYQWERDGQIIEGATGAELIVNEPGNYRGRFSRVENPTESQWNKWSQVVSVISYTPDPSSIQVIGTTCMRGPDNNAAYNAVTLKSVHPNDHYYWYKNGVLVNVPLTNLDDTTRYYKITSSGTTASGTFTLATIGEDKCPSAVSEPVKLYFGNSAPFLADENKPASTSFQGVATSATEANLTWTDNSGIETGYEIWRKVTGGIFVLAGVTGPNAASFHDSGLDPSATYYYKIRAVNNDGRSKYTPSDALSTNVGDNLVLTTFEDPIPPSDPTLLKFVSHTINTITISWTASTDNTGIRKYLIDYGTGSIFTPTNKTTFTIPGLASNTSYTIKVKAVDLGGLLSTGSSNEIVATTHVEGLTYGHSTGSWHGLTEITIWNTPEYTGQVPNFTLAPRIQNDFFCFQFDGYLNITIGGAYQFRTNSDDGSNLSLNNIVIVNNDGDHGNTIVTSAVQTLAPGAYPINVKYYENAGGQTLEVSYTGPDTGGSNNWIKIPDSALNSGTSARMASEGDSNIETETASSEFKLDVYPNPTSINDLNVKIESIDKESPVQIRLMDTMGRGLYDQSFDSKEIRNGVNIKPTATLLTGIYIVVASQGKKVFQKKVAIKN